MELEGKTALVTGAAHRIGKGIAVALAKKGVNLIIHYWTSEEKANQTVSEIRDMGVNASSISTDLRSPDAIQDLFEQISDQEVHIIVNSAATFVKKQFMDLSLSDWEKSIHTNLRAPFLVTQHAARKFQENEVEDALIVNISDLSGIHAWTGFATHSISKAGLIHLTKITSRELAPNIRVNAIIPGAILPAPGDSTQDKKWEKMISSIPLKRSGEPEDIGNAVVYFAQNEFITGTVLPIDGGEALIGPIKH